jgi:hypothetical protein
VCLEAANEHVEGGQAPVRRRGDGEASARPQYPAGLGEQELDVACVLEGLGAEDEVVARVRQGYGVSGSSSTTVACGSRDRAARETSAIVS